MVIAKSTLSILSAVALSVILLGCAGPGAFETPTPAVPTPTPYIAKVGEVTIQRYGFILESLPPERREELEELEKTLIRLAEAQGWAQEEFFMVETDGIWKPGGYLVHTPGSPDETYWILYWLISPSSGSLRQAPGVEGTTAVWDGQCNRFLYQDSQGKQVMGYFPHAAEAAPLVEGLLLYGYPDQYFNFIRESLQWLKSASLEDLGWIQEQCIPGILFRPIAGKAGTASRALITLATRFLDETGEVSREAQRIIVLSVLYHEAVHVNQFNRGEYCWTETEAYDRQVEFIERVRQQASDASQADIQWYVDNVQELTPARTQYVC